VDSGKGADDVESIRLYSGVVPTEVRQRIGRGGSAYKFLEMKN